MADGLCSGLDRKQFVSGVINENGISAGEKSGKCVNSIAASRLATATAESERGETVKRSANREQQNMTATGQHQPPKKVLDAKLSKNKSASMSIVSCKGQGACGAPTGASAGPAGKANNASDANEIEKIVPQRVKNVALHTSSIGAGAGAPSKLQQKKDLKSASAASVDMKGELGDSEQQQDADESPSAKKKRCSDRYDSSESSDSGVATLSCTDSSTASSDASDPGSPYSPVSLGEDANQSSTKANMPPQMLSIAEQNHRVHTHPSHHQKAAPHQTTSSVHQQSQKLQNQKTATVQHQWPWNVSSNNNTISNHLSNNNNKLIVNASNKSSKTSVNSALSGSGNASAKTKRVLSSNPSDTNSTAKKVRSSTLTTDRMHSNAGLTAAASKRLKAQQEESQTKITGYFKSQMKPLKTPLKGDLSTLVPRTTGADAQTALISGKYLNVYNSKAASPNASLGMKDDKDQNNQRKSVAIKKDFIDLPPLTQTMPPSLKKIERKPAKVAQVAPMSRKTSLSQQLKSPKKHIAIAPRTVELSQAQKAPSANAFQIDQTKISQPTVLLTAIRIPPQAGAQSQQLGSSGAAQQTSNKAPALTSTKMGSMLQIPVVPNLVQIPNLLTTANGTNLVMNNGHLTRVGNGGQYFLNGTVLKLQQISNGHSTNASPTNGMLTVDSSALQGNILVKPSTSISQGMPIVTSSAQSKAPALALQQPIVAQASMNGNGCHQAFLTTTSQRISTQPVLMATSSGWYVLNQPTTEISNHIPHTATLSTTMMCKPTRTAVTTLTNAMSPPVPPLATLTNKLETNPALGPKSVPPTVLATTPVPADSKDKLHYFNGIADTHKPLMVECPPLESLSETRSPPVSTVHHKLESPKTVSVSPKTLAPPTIIVTKEVKDQEIATTAAISTKCAISPILSQPKTIRFPVPSGCEAGYRFGPKGTKRSDGVCYWDQCSEKYDTCSKLLDHLQTEHVNTQTGPFSCLWFGCKVRGRESCSRRWLERHVLSHGGTKPFKCIVDGCGLRLGSQLALQKHVNGHFNATESKDNLNKRASDPPIPKVLRKNGKKARYRRQPFSARMFDFFDTGIMEGLQHRLMVTGSLASGSKGAVTFQGRTVARRQTASGITELYVKWSPSEIIPDEWVSESKGALTKTITIQSMRYQERCALHKYLSASSQSDISIKSVSKSHVSPSSVESLSSLFDVDDSSVTTSTTSSSCSTKQSRKPPKRAKIEPS